MFPSEVLEVLLFVASVALVIVTGELRAELTRIRVWVQCGHCGHSHSIRIA